MKAINQRMTAMVDGDFVVFLIGMRIKQWWKIHRWLPLVIAMPRMLKELSKKPEMGLLGFQLHGGIPPLVVQYWRSFDHLEAYAKNSDAEHLPVWRKFNRMLRSNNVVGIWHETYKVAAGQYETIYNGMPPIGLGKVGKLMSISQATEYARDRVKKT